MSFDYKEYWLDKYMDEKSKLIQIDSQLADLTDRRKIVYRNCRRYHAQYKKSVTNKPIVDLDSMNHNIFEKLLEEEEAK